jgi:branched-chain amino acid transport system ATP-binding protein
VLEIDGLALTYGRVRALQGVSLTVGAGEIVALIGANGAGKSSLLRAVAGLERPESGRIAFDGRDIAGASPEAVAGLGIVLVPEGRMILATLTVRENLMLGAFHRRDRAALPAALAGVIARFPDLGPRLDAPGAALSGGQAQMLALARGLMAAPRLMLLDEPSLGLAPRAADDVFAMIASLRAGGATILLVEQNLHRALAIADRAYVLESGRIVIAGKASALAQDKRIAALYLGLKPE